MLTVAVKTLKMIVEFVLISILVALVYVSSKRPKNFPPGPRGLPIFGYFPLFKRLDPEYQFRGLMKLAEIYGPVVGFFVSPRQASVSVCGHKAVREVLLNDDLLGRPGSAVILERTFGERRGLIFTVGHIWQEQRRFAMRHLRDLGFGKSSSENLIQEEIHDLMDHMRSEVASNPSGVVNFKGLFNISLVNIIWAVVTGRRYQRDDAGLQFLINTFHTILRSGNLDQASLPIPAIVFKWFPSLRKHLGLRTDLLVAFHAYIRESVKEHKATRIEGAPRDFIDVFLDEMNKQNSDETTFIDDQLVGTVLDMFTAGSDTTSMTIGFAILQLIHHPDVQKKMQEELDRVCGNSIPTLADRPNLTYTEAVMMESQRIQVVTPVTVPHVAIKDTTILGYTIPKDTVVSVNIHSVHTDPAHWKDPHVFRPERHLGEDGKIIKSDHFLPFATGKRMCPGEPLAKLAYFLFLTTLVKTFHFEGKLNEPLPTLKPIAGITLAYTGFEAAVRPRSV